jgi:hypothetical protein
MHDETWFQKNTTFTLTGRATEGGMIQNSHYGLSVTITYCTYIESMYQIPTDTVNSVVSLPNYQPSIREKDDTD